MDEPQYDYPTIDEYAALVTDEESEKAAKEVYKRNWDYLRGMNNEQYNDWLDAQSEEYCARHDAGWR